MRVGKVSLVGWCRVTEMWVDIPWTSRGPFVGVWGSFSGSCRVSEPRLRLAWMGEGPKKSGSCATFWV